MTASIELGPLAAVRSFVEAFNRGDVDLMQAACSEACAIIDDLPPHQWMGPGATTSWYRDMTTMAAEYDMSDWSVTLDEPRHKIVRLDLGPMTGRIGEPVD